MTCDQGCTKEFEIKAAQTIKLDAGVEKTYFTCPYCQHEYVAFYTDDEIRKLQEKITKVMGKYSSPYHNTKSLMKQERKLKQEIKAKMSALRKRVEGENGHAR